MHNQAMRWGRVFRSTVCAATAAAALLGTALAAPPTSQPAKSTAPAKPAPAKPAASAKLPPPIKAPVATVTPKPAAAATAAPTRWAARRVTVLTGLAAPAAVMFDPFSRLCYVSNRSTNEAAAKGAGFISSFRPEDPKTNSLWVAGTAACPLRAPRGMCVLGGQIFVADGTDLAVFAMDRRMPGQRVPIRGAVKLVDVASNGVDLFAADAGASTVLRIDAQGVPSALKAPRGVRGLTFHAGRLFAVSAEEHELFELDVAGVKAPVPLGMASLLKAPEGVEAMDDGSLIVSDAGAGKVYALSADRKRVQPLFDIKAPGEIGLDRRAGRLFIPSLQENLVAVYDLKPSR